MDIIELAELREENKRLREQLDRISVVNEGKKLTGKQQRFVEEYMVDFNGSRAARDAGYSARRVAETASENVRKSNIAKAIKDKMDEKSEETRITVENILEKLAILGIDGLAAKDADQIRALELLGKHRGLFGDKLVIEREGETQKIISEITSKLMQWVGTLPVELQESAREALVSALID